VVVPNRLLVPPLAPVVPPPNKMDEGAPVLDVVEPKAPLGVAAPVILLVSPVVLLPVLLGKSWGGPGVDPANKDDDPLGAPVDVGVVDTPGDKELAPKLKPVAAAGVDGANVLIVEEPHVTMAVIRRFFPVS
jgi:hypothetical protein